jgi:hypothetical protein
LVKEIRIYFEGAPALRPGFRSFLDAVYEAARIKKVRIQLIAGEARPVHDFSLALKTHPDSANFLLMDAEKVDDGALIASLKARNDWKPPPGMAVQDSSLNFMVALMEAWFLPERDALKHYYGDRFKEARLPANPKVEEISPSDVIHGMEEASQESSKGKYHKTRHAPDLLKEVNPLLVRATANHCERFFSQLLAVINA